MPVIRQSLQIDLPRLLVGEPRQIKASPSLKEARGRRFFQTFHPTASTTIQPHCANPIDAIGANDQGERWDVGTEQADAPEQPPIEIKVLTGPPGCRKTTRMREDALRVPGLYLFSMPTKALIEEQAAEFRKAQPSLPVFSVHADIKPKRKINRQIEEALAAVRDGGHQHAVVMLTHVSMMAEDLTGFHGWHARIDEAPNSVQSGKVAVTGAEALFESLFALEDFGHAKWRVLKPLGPRPSYFETKNNPALAPSRGRAPCS